MTPARRARRLAIALALLTLAASCDDGQDHDGPGKSRPNEPQTLGEPNTELFAVDPKPLWRSRPDSEVRTLEVPGGARFQQDSLVLQGLGDARLAVVDAATGKPRWTDATVKRHVDASAPAEGMAPIVRAGKAWDVLLHYQDLTESDPAGRDGIALVAGEDGRARWHALLPAHVSQGGESAPELQAADEKVAVTTIGDENPTVWAVDVSDGSTLWDASGVWPQLIAAGTILGLTSRHSPAEANEDDDKPYVTALDASTGKKRWDLKGSYEWSKVLLGAGNVALVVAKTATGPSGYQAIAVDARTGQDLTTLGDIDSDGRGCASDGQTTIVCKVLDYSSGSPGHRLVTFDVAKRERRVSPIYPDTSALSTARIDGVWGDHIFVTDGNREPSEYRAVDQEGHVVSRKLPGRLVGISDQYAVFTDLVDSRGSAYAVYRVR